jgi:hypothetical protein
VQHLQNFILSIRLSDNYKVELKVSAISVTETMSLEQYKKMLQSFIIHQ